MATNTNTSAMRTISTYYALYFYNYFALPNTTHIPQLQLFWYFDVSCILYFVLGVLQTANLQELLPTCGRGGVYGVCVGHGPRVIAAPPPLPRGLTTAPRRLYRYKNVFNLINKLISNN